MKITWYGTASILLEIAETSLLFDPFLKCLPNGYESKKLYRQREAAFGTAANILITHGHMDHLSSVMSLYENKPCTIFLTGTPATTLTKQGFPEAKLHRIAPGDVLHFPGVSVCVYQGKHIHFDAKLILQKAFSLNAWRHFSRLLYLLQLNFQYRENNEIVFYEIRAEGKRIQIMGSADLADEVEYPIGADALILPHQGRSDIDSHNEAIIKRLNPKRVLLDHYDDAFPPISELVPVDAFCKKMSVTVPTENLIEGRPIEI
ncbi:MAG: MBL fold metallo-hydrolase [Clostridiales bacterium]|nr:MBL fold metallo-hydrolase [Clostridiales bacterium]MCC8099041.1 MBL fold metallo-hydrolase [Clostridiales bacterium]